MSGYCKYYKQKRQYSNDNGQTWFDVYPAEYQKGALIEADSVDCGYVGEITRWVNSGTTCSGTSGYDKYNMQVKQTSSDGGNTWITTSEYQLGTLIQANSTDCGYTPPSGTTKLSATYSDSSTYTVACNNSSSLSQGEVRGGSNSSMRTAVIGHCVTTIGNSAFFACSGLTSITIPDSVTSIGYGAFSWSSGLTSIDIPDSVTSIGKWAFGDCNSLTSINIPDTVTEIGDNAFFACSGLTSVTIGSGVTSIGSTAFYNCSRLAEVTINATTPPAFGSWVFEYTNDCPIYVPASSVNAYKSAPGWSTYASRIQAIP